jgi:FtsH-binding integral membrane protein
MGGGLALTGIVAYVAASSGFYQAMAATPLIWIVMLAPLGFVLVLSFGIQRISASTAVALFWIYAAVMGLSLGSIFLVFTGISIARVFFITAATFGAMSLYGYTTRSDLSGFGSFLLMGLSVSSSLLHRQHLCRIECPSVCNLRHRRLCVRWPYSVRHATHKGDVSRLRHRRSRR